MKTSDLLARHARSRPNNRSFHCAGTDYTWSQTNVRVDALVAHLVSHTEPGDRVALFAKNCHRYWEIEFACARAGLISVPINYRLGVTEVMAICSDVGARVAFVDAESIDEKPDLRQAFGVDLIIELDVHGARDEYEAIVNRTPLSPNILNGRECAVNAIGFTSGTTGRARGAVLTHHTSMTAALWLSTLFELTEDDVFLACLPAYVYRAGGGGMAAAVSGACTVVVDFDAGTVLDTIEQHAVTSMILAPIMANRVIEAGIESRHLSSLESVWLGGSPSTTRTIGRLQQALPGAKIGAVYGMTEATGICSGAWPTLNDDEHRHRTRSVGHPSPLVDFRIIDPNGNPVDAGQTGQIAVRGDSVMQYYWGSSADKDLRNGWFHTGDVGFQDKDGFVYLVDRRADIIVSGGINVYSVEVEQALTSHPSVVECTVLGLPDDEWGEIVTAVVVTHDPAPEDAELTAHLRTLLGGFKVPKRIVRRDILPRSAMGKVDKKVLRSELDVTARSVETLETRGREP